MNKTIKIKMKLKDVVKNDKLVEQAGLNPYCVNEGADGEEYIEVEVEGIKLTKGGK